MINLFKLLCLFVFICVGLNTAYAGSSKPRADAALEEHIHKHSTQSERLINPDLNKCWQRVGDAATTARYKEQGAMYKELLDLVNMYTLEDERKATIIKDIDELFSDKWLRGDPWKWYLEKANSCVARGKQV